MNDAFNELTSKSCVLLNSTCRRNCLAKMPLRLDIVDAELPLSCLKASLFRADGVVHDDTSLDIVKQCKWCISILGDKVVVAEHKTAVIISVVDSVSSSPSGSLRKTSVNATALIASSTNDKTSKVVSEINIDEYEELNQTAEIGAVLCLPVQTHASTWWTCVAVATTSGVVHFFTDDGRHLAWQRMHTRAVIDMRIIALALAEPGAYAERDFAGLLIYFEDGVCVSVEGSHLLQCLEIYRRSKARIFARAAQSESEELFPLIQITKLSVAPQAFAYGNTAVHSGDAIDAVPQACIRRKCSRLEQLQNASFLGGFDASVRVALPTYSIYVSPSIYRPTGSSSAITHELLAFSFVADDHIHISISELASLAADKVKSSVKSTLKSASTLFGLTSALSYGSGRGSDSARNQPNPEEILNTKRSKAVPAKTVSQEPRFAIDERTGSERQLARMEVSPNGLYVACVDNLARVLLVNVLSGLIVHIFKGYRDAQVAWLAPDSSGAVPPESVSEPVDSVMQHDASGLSKPAKTAVAHIRPCLLIYEAKRGLLELWRIGQPPQRIFVRAVQKNARLISTSAAMLTTPFWSASAGAVVGNSDESRTTPLSKKSREQHHQQPQAKCFLAVSNFNAAVTSASTASARPQQLVTLIPLHLPAYLLHGGDASNNLSEHSTTQQHARDLTLVQSFLSLQEDMSSQGNADESDDRCAADMVSAFELIQSDALRLECVLKVMQNQHAPGLTLQLASRLLTQLFEVVKKSSQVELENCRDELKRRLIQGHVWHVLETCLQLLNFYKCATHTQAVREIPKMISEKAMSLSELLGISDNECEILIHKWFDIVQAKERFSATPLPKAVGARITWSEFATQAFDLSSYVKLSPQTLTIRDSAPLAATLFEPLFTSDRDGSEGNAASHVAVLQNFVDNSCFKLSHSRLLLSFLQFWCSSGGSLISQSANIDTFARNVRRACQIARHLFGSSSSDEKVRMLETVERQTNHGACLPIALVFRATVAATSKTATPVTDDVNMDDEQHADTALLPTPFSLDSYQMPSIPTDQQQNLASPMQKRRKSFSEDNKNTEKDVDPADKNTMLVDYWSLACVRLHDLLAYEHLTSLTYKIFLNIEAVAEKSAEDQQRLQKSCKKFSISDVLNKGGLTEYVAKWLVWSTMPEILNPNDIYRVLSVSSSAKSTIAAALITQLSDVGEKKIVISSSSSVGRRFFSFGSSAGTAENDDEDSEDDYDKSAVRFDAASEMAVEDGNLQSSRDNSRRRFSRSSSSGKRKSGGDEKNREIRNEALERLAYLERLLPLSLAREDVIANCTWEAARAWHEQPHQLMWLRTACRFAQLVQNALVRHGLCSMIWHVVGVSRRLNALSLRCDRTGRMPKDRLVREASEIGFASTAETLKFLRVVGDLLQLSVQTAFATEQSAALLAVVALPDIEQRWSSSSSAASLLAAGSGASSSSSSVAHRRTAALLDIAVEQKRVSTDLLQLHALEVELLKAIFSLQLRNVNLLSLFTPAEAEALKEKLDESKFSAASASTAAQQKTTQEARVAFLERVLQSTVTNEHHTAPQQRHGMQPNMFWYQQAIQLAHCWNMDVDVVVRAPFVQHLYSAGFCRAAQEVYGSAGDKSDLSQRVLEVIGRRIAHALQQRGGDNETERVIVEELANHLSTSVRTWLRDRDSAALLQPGIVTLKHCRDMLRLVLSATPEENTDTGDAQKSTKPRGLSNAERAIAGELERELSDVFDMHRVE